MRFSGFYRPLSITRRPWLSDPLVAVDTGVPPVEENSTPPLVTTGEGYSAALVGGFVTYPLLLAGATMGYSSTSGSANPLVEVSLIPQPSEAYMGGSLNPVLSFNGAQLRGAATIQGTASPTHAWSGGGYAVGYAVGSASIVVESTANGSVYGYSSFGGGAEVVVGLSLTSVASLGVLSAILSPLVALSAAATGTSSLQSMLTVQQAVVASGVGYGVSSITGTLESTPVVTTPVYSGGSGGAAVRRRPRRVNELPDGYLRGEPSTAELQLLYELIAGMMAEGAVITDALLELLELLNTKEAPKVVDNDVTDVINYKLLAELTQEVIKTTKQKRRSKHLKQIAQLMDIL